jgi:hypothetical protein
MISFNNLGNLGRLGNQMFQYASLRGIAANRGFDFCIPSEHVFGVSDSNVKNSTCNIHNVFNLSSVKCEITSNRIVQESSYHFDEDLFNYCDDDVDLYGYFQTEKYFKSIEEDIKKDFTFSEELLNSCSEFIEQISSTNKIISLHVRHGDYLNLQSYHPVPSIEYYSKALSLLPDLPVMLFTDDPEWCLEQELFDSDRFLLSQSNEANVDMCMMSLCSHHIIANSSFSWWGAWLAKSQKVIAPKVWFGPSLVDKNTDDLYCKEWIKL